MLRAIWDMPIQFIAKKLGFTEYAIRRKGELLGLRRRKA